MGEFFKPWRRKIGVLTLLIACLAMGGWMRSLTTVDQFAHLSGEFDRGYVQSVNGFLVWWSDATSGNRLWSILEIQWNGGFRMAGLQNSFFDNIDAPGEVVTDWFVRWPFFRIGRERGGNHKTFVHYVSYSTIAAPLTVLSAYLLLSKPRKSTPKKIMEPIPKEGS